MQRESDKRRSWKNKERERWDLKRLLDEQKNNVFSQALALAILNGTADKMELEKREKEENEYSSLSSLDLSSNIDFQMFHSHFSSELGCEKRMRIWKRQQKPPSLRRIARSPSSPTPPSSSSPPITSESGQGGSDILEVLEGIWRIKDYSKFLGEESKQWKNPWHEVEC